MASKSKKIKRREPLNLERFYKLFSVVFQQLILGSDGVSCDNCNVQQIFVTICSTAILFTQKVIARKAFFLNQPSSSLKCMFPLYIQNCPIKFTAHHNFSKLKFHNISMPRKLQVQKKLQFLNVCEAMNKHLRLSLRKPGKIPQLTLPIEDNLHAFFCDFF